LCDALVLAPQLHLLVIGGAPELVEAQARRAGVADRLHAPGRVSDADLPHYLAACDALVLPLEDNLTNRGRWPHKLGDMIAAQRPVIVSRGGEFPALLEHHAAALIVEHSPAAFARAMTEVVAEPARFAAMAQRGRALVEQRLNWDVIGGDLARAVERATGAR
jgi:glycosyltransferase involved in cell wall biosynthesis